MRTLRGLAALIAALSFAVFAAPALALPPPGSCAPDCEPEPAPEPTQTTIHRLSPEFGWSGDLMEVQGTRLRGASVSVAGKPAEIRSGTDTRLRFVVPEIAPTSIGPSDIPVTVTGGYGTASTTFLFSDAIYLRGGASWGTEGRAHATVELHRNTGRTDRELTIHNFRFWSALTVDVAVAWMDKDDKVVAYSAPRSFAVASIFNSWPNGDPMGAGAWTNDPILPVDAAAKDIRAGRMLLVIDGAPYVVPALTDAIATHQTFSEVMNALGPRVTAVP